MLIGVKEVENPELYVAADAEVVEVAEELWECDDGDVAVDDPSDGVVDPALDEDVVKEFLSILGVKYFIKVKRCQPGIPCWGGSGCRMPLQRKASASVPEPLNC